MPVLLFTWKSTTANFFAGTNKAAVFPLNFYSSETLQLTGRDTSRSLSSSAAFSVPATAPLAFYGVSNLATISNSMSFSVPESASIIGGGNSSVSLATSVNFSAY